MIETASTSQFEYVGFWRRVAVAYLDSLILWPFFFLSFWADQWSFRLRLPWPSVAMAVIQFAITLFFVVRYGGPPAKLILRMRIVDVHGTFLDVSHAIRRDVINWMGFLLSLPALLSVVANIPTGYVPSDLKQAGDAYLKFGGIWGTVSEYWLLVIFLDVLVVCCNRRKRAAHDFLAGSFVITKRSYDEVKCLTI